MSDQYNQILDTDEVERRCLTRIRFKAIGPDVLPVLQSSTGGVEANHKLAGYTLVPKYVEQPLSFLWTSGTAASGLISWILTNNLIGSRVLSSGLGVDLVNLQKCSGMKEKAVDWLCTPIEHYLSGDGLGANGTVTSAAATSGAGMVAGSRCAPIPIGRSTGQVVALGDTDGVGPQLISIYSQVPVANGAAGVNGAYMALGNQFLPACFYVHANTAAQSTSRFVFVDKWAKCSDTILALNKPLQMGENANYTINLNSLRTQFYKVVAADLATAAAFVNASTSAWVFDNTVAATGSVVLESCPLLIAYIDKTDPVLNLYRSVPNLGYYCPRMMYKQGPASNSGAVVNSFPLSKQFGPRVRRVYSLLALADETNARTLANNVSSIQLADGTGIGLATATADVAGVIQDSDAPMSLLTLARYAERYKSGSLLHADTTFTRYPVYVSEYTQTQLAQWDKTMCGKQGLEFDNGNLYTVNFTCDLLNRVVYSYIVYDCWLDNMNPAGATWRSEYQAGLDAVQAM